MAWKRITRTKHTHICSQGKPRHGETEYPIDDYWVRPDTAISLKTGRQANKYQVTAIVTKADKRFRNGKPALLAKFDQRTFDRRFWSTHTTVAIVKPKPDRKSVG